MNDIDFIKAVIPTNFLNKIIGWISENLEPEDVFEYRDLSDWALQNGFDISNRPGITHISIDEIDSALNRKK